MPHLEFECRLVSVGDAGDRKTVSGVGGIRVLESDILHAEPALFIPAFNALIESTRRLLRGGMLTVSPPEKPPFRELEEAVQLLKSGSADLECVLVEPRSVSGKPHKCISFVFRSGV